MSNHGGSTIRYDVVWTLPFSEFARAGYTDTMTWWLDSIHTTEVGGKKRFEAIARAVKANNGAAVLFEVIVDPKASTFNLRAIERAGRECKPPLIADINPVTVDVDSTFKQFCAKWEARNKQGIAAADKLPPRLVAAKPRPKQTQGAGAAIGALLAVFTAVLTAAFVSYTPTPAASSSNGVKGFRSRIEIKEAEVVTPKERPQQRAYIPLRYSESQTNQCEVYMMSESTGRMTSLGKGACP
jgi:hypothetical protein